ncbi:MAG: BBP7 family outer membrane beta-barrel protein [Gemmataceae bacterium]|nr:BBP7 family outer membrane beta-barrel protein [Gemmataceae bacterium]
MKALWIGSLAAISLAAIIGFAAAPGSAYEPAWRPAGAAPAFQRVAPAANSAVTLNRPVPLGAAQESTGVVPAALLDRPLPTFRAKTIEPDDVPRLLPVGPAQHKATTPGVVKPLTQVAPRQVEPLPAPRPTQTFSAPMPAPGAGDLCGPALCSPSQGVCRPPSWDVVTVNQGFVVDDGVTCDVECCTTCVSETCGACWGKRWRDSCSRWWCEDPCCRPRPRCWLRGEYLLMGISDANLPPLVTSEFAPIRSPDQAGVLPISPILFPDPDHQDEVRSGGRFAFGFWFPRRCNWGLDASFFMLAPRTTHVEFSSDGSPVLARPFQDANTGGESAQLVAYPGLLAGTLTFDSTVRFWGVDAHLRRRWCCGPRWWLDGFIGYRHLNLADTIDIHENLQITDPAAGGARFVVNDHFGTRNNFNGAQIGLEGELKIFRRWFLAGNLKFAMGGVHQIVNIDGATTFSAPGAAPVTGRGGLYALASNIGRHERTDFAVANEFGIKLGFDVNEHWRIYAGYNILYLSNVVRAGDQIDRVVNFNLAPEPGNLNPAVVQPARPAVLFRQSDFWAQGGQFGIEYHW